jgi:hypothetical protein
MSRLRYNNALGLLATGGLSLSGTTINFQSVPPFATLSGGDYIPIVIEPPTTQAPSPNFEIVHLTAYTASTTSGTILRAQDGTAASAHAGGANWTCAPTAEDFTGSGGATIATYDAPDSSQGPGATLTVASGILAVTASSSLPPPPVWADSSGNIILPGLYSVQLQARMPGSAGASGQYLVAEGPFAVKGQIALDGFVASHYPSGLVRAVLFADVQSLGPLDVPYPMAWSVALSSGATGWSIDVEAYAQRLAY